MIKLGSSNKIFTTDVRLWQRLQMESSLTDLELSMIVFSLLVFALFTLKGMFGEEHAQSDGMAANTHIGLSLPP